MKRGIILVAVMLVLSLTFVGCGAKSEPQPSSPDANQGTAPNANQGSAEPKNLSGSITIAGSTSVQPLAEELAMMFMEENRGVRINVSGGGSGAGVESAGNGVANIGMASREIKQSELDQYKELKPIVICKDGISVVVNPKNKVNELTLEQIQGIFSGEITNWSQVGGEDGSIIIVNREEGSGTRGAFEELVLGDKDFVTKAIIQNSTGAIRTAVASDVNAIGYVSMGAMSNDVKAVVVDGADATAENVLNGSYKLARPFNFLTSGEADEVTQAFIDWVLSDGQEFVKQEGFISVQ